MLIIFLIAKSYILFQNYNILIVSFLHNFGFYLYNSLNDDFSIYAFVFSMDWNEQA